MQEIVANIVSRHFDNHGKTVDILKGVSFNVSHGEICALTGASGAGKTTLMNLIGLLDRPSEGDIVINGQSTYRLTANEIADLRNREIGFVFQSFHLLDRLSALDNVALPLLYRGIGRSERRRRAHTLLQRLGLADRHLYQPDRLSGGQRQRVAIARALIGEPSLLLADEPTGNLDSSAAQEVMDLFRELNEQLGLTILIVTHDPAIAASCPRQLVLHDGQLLKNATDTGSELSASLDSGTHRS